MLEVSGLFSTISAEEDELVVVAHDVLDIIARNLLDDGQFVWECGEVYSGLLCLSQVRPVNIYCAPP